MGVPTFYRVLSSRSLLLKVGRVRSKMNTYSIFDHNILEWMTAAWCSSSYSMSIHRLQISEQ